MTSLHHPARMRLKLRELSQLFNSMDPSPFLERDLDHDAEEFILSWARELPKGHGFELDVHVAHPPEPDAASDLEGAVQHYFATRAEIKRAEFRVLLRRGHVSLAIGLVFLATCLITSGIVAKLGHATTAEIVREGLIIAGWVAMWRPLEIYLYDWWPLREECRILQRLARIRVRLTLPHASDLHSRANSAVPAMAEGI